MEYSQIFYKGLIKCYMFITNESVGHCTSYTSTLRDNTYNVSRICTPDMFHGRYLIP